MSSCRKKREVRTLRATISKLSNNNRAKVRKLNLYTPAMESGGQQDDSKKDNSKSKELNILQKGPHSLRGDTRKSYTGFQ